METKRLAFVSYQFVPKVACWLNEFRFTHIITGLDTREMPNEIGGGILADEMGLGKTLTMLSAIIGTADKAKRFADTTQRDTNLDLEQDLAFSPATLVIVPSPCKHVSEVSLAAYKC